MSEEGIEQRLLKRFRTNYLAFVEAFNRRDLEAAFARTPRDFVFDVSDGVLVEHPAFDMLSSAVMHGREELIAFYRDWIEQFPDWHVDVEGFAEPTPGVLLVTFTARGTGRVSGVPIGRRITEVWDTRSRPIRVSQHREEADALEAAGLSE
jgi:SnoaL-like domain